MARGDHTADGAIPDAEQYVPPDEPDLDYLLGHLTAIEQSLDDPEGREMVRRSIKVARRLPGGRLLEQRIQKYTTRDVAEAFVGAILLSLPMMVEDGVFEIAGWLTRTTVSGVPLFLVGNIAFVVLLTVGLIYWSDIREVHITNPIFGVIPRRLVGVLSISLFTTAFLLVLWGRHVAGDPASTLEIVARVTVIWAAAAFGAALGDILPGESRGHDLRVENLDEIITPGE